MPPETAAHDEAQRTLERKALRNVRSLVDKLEDETRRDSKVTMRFAVGSIVVALVAAVIVYFAMVSGKQQHAPIDSAAKPVANRTP